MRSVMDQVERLGELGVPGGAALREWAAGQPDVGAVVVVHPDHVPASALAPLLERQGKPGFVVQDMPDLDEFVPIEGIELPDGPAYLVADPQRGDEMANWSPHEALPVITESGRSPMTVNEGICWLLQEPGRLERNHCFMTIGSRKPKASGLDSRTPAMWVSNGTGRDGAERRDAPKVGWCWAGNRHTWLGFGSVAERLG